MFFKPLGKEEIKKIVDLQFEYVTKRLKEKEINITLNDKAKELIIAKAFDPVYGARPIKRYIQKNIETLIAKAIIKDEIESGIKAVIDVKGDELFLTKE